MSTQQATGYAITLTTENLDLLRIGVQVHADDGAGRTVHLYPWGSPAPRPDGFAQFRAELPDADLDLIEQQPEGLVVADVTRATGWTVRLEGAR